MIPLEPDERVLFLSIPPAALVEEAAKGVPHGIVVVIGSRDQVYDARAQLAHLENVMVVPATPDNIPWQDGFFSCVVDVTGLANEDPLVAREVKRVLAEGGRMVSQTP